MLKRLLHHEAAAGILLMLAAVLAMIISNSRFVEVYHAFLDFPLLGKDVVHWINDGLMVIFFFLVGLEIKRECLEGNLSTRAHFALPVAAAAGGMMAPALIYTLCNWGDVQTIRGWAIPAATDIAFALGALAIVGSRAPSSLKVFLLALATLDDLGAIMIIAGFYTASLSMVSLALAGAVFLALLALNRFRIDNIWAYAVLGVALWLCILQSGVHATIAGVALAFTIPLKRRDGSDFIGALEKTLHPYVTFLILPVFAFANAGVELSGVSLSQIFEPLPLGIIAGLVIGKPLGIVLTVLVCVGLGVARLPAQASWRQVLGVACLAGIGFTMSLFIGTLAFSDKALLADVRLAVITGSVISALLGISILWSARARS